MSAGAATATAGGAVDGAGVTFMRLDGLAMASRVSLYLDTARQGAAVQSSSSTEISLDSSAAYAYSGSCCLYCCW